MCPYCVDTFNWHPVGHDAVPERIHLQHKTSRLHTRRFWQGGGVGNYAVCIEPEKDWTICTLRPASEEVVTGGGGCDESENLPQEVGSEFEEGPSLTTAVVDPGGADRTVSHEIGDNLDPIAQAFAAVKRYWSPIKEPHAQ